MSRHVKILKKLMKRFNQPKWKKTLIAVAALVFVAGLVTVLTRFRTKPETSKAAVSWELPASPIRVAWYYAWFWGDGQGPTDTLNWGYWSPYIPSISQRLNESYQSGDPRVVEQHIRDLDYGKYDAAAFSWNGQNEKGHSQCVPGNNPRDCLLGYMMDKTKTMNKPLKWTILDEYENFYGKTLAQTKADLIFFRDNFFNRGNFLKVNGKPVIFVFNTPRFESGENQCDVVARWETAQQQTGIDVYFSPKVAGSTFDTCSVQPETWFNWGVNLTKNGYKLSDSIRPGFWDPIDNEFNNDVETGPVHDQFDKYERRDPAGWPTEVQRQVTAGAKWQFTESFNDWAEGHSVESAYRCTARDVASNPVGRRTEGTDRCPPHLNGWQTSSGYGLYLDALHNNPPRPGGSAPTVSLSASDTTVTAGSNVTMSWTVSGNADSCTGTGGGLTAWNGDRAHTNGTHTLSIAPGSTRTFTIECTNEAGSASDSVTVTVGTVPTLTLAASPSTITSGASSTLTWVVNDANSCTASGGWTGSKAAGDGSHSQSVSPASTTTYNLVCSNQFGSSSPIDTVTVAVSSTAPPTVTLNISKTTMKPPESAVLTWSSSNATSCTANGSWTGSKATSGTQTVNPINDVLYNLTCTGPGGENSANTGIDVTPSLINGDIADPPNGNGYVNANDLSFLITRWNTTNMRADLNNDGVVSFTDFSMWAVYNVQANP
jgi:hypothetical protein